MSQKQIKKFRKETESQQHEEEGKKKTFIWVTRSLAVILIIAAGMLIYYKNTKTDPKIDALAKCLTEKKIVMYGSETCSACQVQKKMFGQSFQYINFVNCTDNPICKEKSIRAYPTWEFNEERFEEVQELNFLAEKAGCEFK